MRALFIDFDGVLHDALATFGLSPVVPVAEIRRARPLAFVYARTLAALLQAHADVRVVVHSSWRAKLSDDELQVLVPELQPWFAGSVGHEYRGRSEAVRAWVEAHRPTDVRVLDDEPQLFDSSWPELVVCDKHLGLGDSVVQTQLRAWLFATAPNS